MLQVRFRYKLLMETYPQQRFTNLGGGHRLGYGTMQTTCLRPSSVIWHTLGRSRNSNPTFATIRPRTHKKGRNNDTIYFHFPIHRWELPLYQHSPLRKGTIQTTCLRSTSVIWHTMGFKLRLQNPDPTSVSIRLRPKMFTPQF